MAAERLRARALQTALTNAQFERVEKFVVDYLGDRLDRATHGDILVLQVGHEVDVEVHGDCDAVLSLVTPIVGELLELLSLELGIAFTQSQAPLCASKVWLVPSSPPSAPPRPSSPPSPPPHIVILVDGHNATDDPDFHVTMYADLPYVMTFAGNHTFYSGELAKWTLLGVACPAALDTYTALDVSLSVTMVLSAGSYELCLDQTGHIPTKHPHITAVVLSLPPSPPPPLLPPSLPPPTLPPSTPSGSTLDVSYSTVISFQASGSVSDFGVDEKAAIATSFAAVANVSADAVSIAITAGSVHMTVTIEATDQASNAATTNVLSTALISAGSLSSLLNVTIEGTPSITSLATARIVLAPSPPPPSPLPSLPPRSPPPPFPLPPLLPGGSVAKTHSLLTTITPVEPTPSLSTAQVEQIAGRFAAQAKVAESAVSVITHKEAVDALASANEQLDVADLAFWEAVKQESDAAFYDASRLMEKAKQEHARWRDTLELIAEGTRILVEVATASSAHSDNISLLLALQLSSVASASEFVGLPLHEIPIRDLRVKVVINPAPAPPPAPPAPPPSPKPEIPVHFVSLLETLNVSYTTSEGNLVETAKAAQDFMSSATDTVISTGEVLAQETVATLMMAAANVLPPPATNATAETTEASTVRTETAKTALNFVAAVTSAASSMSVETAATATAVISYVLEELSIADSGAGTGDVVTTAVTGIANAVLMQASSSDVTQNETRTVTVSSPNLNITAESKPAAEIATKPSVCETASAPAEVQLPSAILSVAAGVNTSQPVNIIFFSSAVNFHPLTFSDNSSDVNLSGPLVSYSLHQNGVQLDVKGATDPINITLPLLAGRPNGTGQACVGDVTSVSSECTSVISCRFWNTNLQEWSSEGCRTVIPTEGSVAGTVLCQCDHLTEFVAFEFPTSASELLADILAGFAINVLSWDEIVACLGSPNWDRYKFVYIIAISVTSSFFVFLLWAASRDNEELKTKERLIAGILPRGLTIKRMVGSRISSKLSSFRQRLNLRDSAAVISKTPRTTSHFSDLSEIQNTNREPGTRRTLGLKTARVKRQQAETSRALAAMKKETMAERRNREERCYGRQDTADVFGGLAENSDACDMQRLEAIRREIESIPISMKVKGACNIANHMARVDQMIVKAGDFMNDQVAAILAKGVDDRLAAEAEAAAPTSRVKQFLDQAGLGTSIAPEASTSVEGAVGSSAMQRLQRSLHVMRALQKLKRQDVKVAKENLKRMDLREIAEQMRVLQGEQPRRSLKGVVVRRCFLPAPSVNHTKSRDSSVSDSMQPRPSNKMKNVIAARRATHPQEASQGDSSNEGAVVGGVPAAAGRPPREESHHIRVEAEAQRSVAWRLAPAETETEAEAMVAVMHKALEKPEEREPSIMDSSTVSSISSMWSKHNDGIRGMGEHAILLTAWQKEANSLRVRLRLAFYKSHTLMAPLFFNGVEGFTRAQTIMFLFNTVALELVVLSMQFSPPDEGDTVVINPVQIFFSAMLAAAICIPGTWLFAVLFEPIVLLRFFQKLLLLPICWPFWLRKFIRKRRGAGIDRGVHIFSKAVSGAAAETALGATAASSAVVAICSREKSPSDASKEQCNAVPLGIEQERAPKSSLGPKEQPLLEATPAIAENETSAPVAPGVALGCGVLPPVGSLLEERINALERALGVDLDGDGDIGLPGHPCLSLRPSRDVVKAFGTTKQPEGLQQTSIAEMERHDADGTSTRDPKDPPPSPPAQMVVGAPRVDIPLTRLRKYQGRPAQPQSPSSTASARSADTTVRDGAFSPDIQKRVSALQWSGVGSFRTVGSGVTASNNIIQWAEQAFRKGYSKDDWDRAVCPPDHKSLSLSASQPSPPPSPPSSAPAGKQGQLEKNTLDTRGRASSLEESTLVFREGSELLESARTFSLTSVERLRKKSLRRALRERPTRWRSLLFILTGWGLNYVCFFSLQATFISYGCKFAGEDAVATASGGSRRGGGGRDAKAIESRPPPSPPPPPNLTQEHQDVITTGELSPPSPPLPPLLPEEPSPPPPPEEPPLATAGQASNYLLTSWAISVVQRFFLNEPIIILVAFFLPICFANECIGNLCGETVTQTLDVFFEVLFAMLKSLKG